MAENIIDKFSYDGNTYKLQDNVSGYVTASGAASAAPVQSVNGSTGAVTVVEGLTPLIGYTTNTTPSQVLNAVQEGRDVDIKYNDDDWGLLHFTSFNVASSFGVVIGNTILYYYGTLYAFQLIGTSGAGTWELRSDILVQNSTLSNYVPTSRTINGTDLSSDITLSASDVGALPDTTVIPIAATTNPLMDGTAAVGTGTTWARADHVHPSDTNKVDVEVVDGSIIKGFYNSGDDNYIGFGMSDEALGYYSSITTSLVEIDIGTTDDDTGRSNYITMTPAATTIHNVVTPTANGDAANKQYVDTQVATKQATLVSGTNIKTINNESLLGSGNISISSGATTTWYGTSSTAAGTAAKVVTCADFTLQKGTIIGVLFSTANTAATPTLNVNSTGAKTIYVGTSTLNATTNVLKWSANTMLYFMYDGTYYRYITSVAAASVQQPRGAGTWYGTSSTAAGTTAKTSTIANYVLTPGAMVAITFTTANTAVAPTLNINSTGAKAIYYKNAAVSSSNLLLWNANETLIFVYSGSYYYYLGKNTAGGTDVQINGTSITSVGIANIVTNGTYDSSTNKIATMNDLPVLTFTPSGNNLIISQQQVSGITNGNAVSY